MVDKEKEEDDKYCPICEELKDDCTCDEEEPEEEE
jgi:hypothetical protein